MERDTWILIAIVAGIIGAVWYFNRETAPVFVDALAPAAPPKALDRAAIRSSLGLGVPVLRIVAPALDDGSRRTFDPSLFRF